MTENQRIDYFRSEMEGKLAKLREEFTQKIKSLENRLVAAEPYRT
jgi:hypothetical protein